MKPLTAFPELILIEWKEYLCKRLMKIESLKWEIDIYAWSLIMTIPLDWKWSKLTELSSLNICLSSLKLRNSSKYNDLLLSILNAFWESILSDNYFSTPPNAIKYMLLINDILLPAICAPLWLQAAIRLSIWLVINWSMRSLNSVCTLKYKILIVIYWMNDF